MPKRPIATKTGKAVSLGSALDDIGFKPLSRRLKVIVGVDYRPLRRSSGGLGHAMRND